MAWAWYLFYFIAASNLRSGGIQRQEITRLRQQLRQLLQRLLVLLRKPIQLRAINIDDSNDLPTHQSPPHTSRSAKPIKKKKTYLSILHNRHHNLTPTRPITRNVSRKLLHIIHQLRALRLRRLPADSPPKRNRLTRDLSLERPQQQLPRLRRIRKVEPRPVHRSRGPGKRVICVPEEGRRVGEVARNVSWVGRRSRYRWHLGAWRDSNRARARVR